MRSFAFREFKRLALWKIRWQQVLRRDAHMALTLMWYVKWFDGRIFGDQDTIPVIAYGGESKYLAGCVHVQDGSQCYIVYALNMVPRVLAEMRLRAAHRIFPTSRGPLTVTEYLIAAAAHEVRHRLQHAGVLPHLFSPELAAKPADHFLRSLWQVERVRHWADIQTFRAQGADPQFIEGRSSNREFDARLIEQLVLHRVSACATSRELVHLVLTEPTTAERRA